MRFSYLLLHFIEHLFQITHILNFFLANSGYAFCPRPEQPSDTQSGPHLTRER